MAKYAYHRLDANHQQIRLALKMAGATVNEKGPLDLLVGFRGANYLLEVKTGQGEAPRVAGGVSTRLAGAGDCGPERGRSVTGYWRAGLRGPGARPEEIAMKIRVTLKDPDTMQDAVDDAVKRLERPDGVDADEWADIRESRADKIKSDISSRWMRYGEYLDVEFDTDAHTVTVLPAGRD